MFGHFKTFFMSHKRFFWLPIFSLISQREGGRTHRPRVPAHERRWLYFWGIQVRESAPASGTPRAHFLPINLCPVHAFLLFLAGLELCTPSLLSTFTADLKWPWITSNTNITPWKGEVPPHLDFYHPEAQDFFSSWALGRLWMLLRVGLLLCVCLIWHCDVMRGRNIFRFKGFGGYKGRLSGKNI